MIGLGSSARLAVSGDGHATVVFETGAGAEHKTLWANHFDPVSGSRRSSRSMPLLVQLAGNSDGRAVAVVELTTDTAQEVRALRYEPDVGWGTALLIESTPPSQILVPNALGRFGVVVDDAGTDAVGGAMLLHGTGADITARRYTP